MILEIIKHWKELNLERAVFEFNCGGDSMGDTTWFLKNKDNEDVTDAQIEEFLENIVYDRVEFYENSDGHYIGEAGEVIVTLSDDEVDFDFSKSSQSEWSEQITSELEIDLTDDEIEFINNYVLNINGSQDGNTINYKRDFIMTDKIEKIAADLTTKIEEQINDFSPNIDDDCELDDWFNFTTNEDDNGLEIKDAQLVIHLTNTYTEFRDE